MRILPVLFCALALPLAACGSSSTPTTNMDTGATIVAGGGTNRLTLGVNSYLWHATLDTLAFMPLASADPFGGVVITDWYVAPNAPDERLKVTIYIMDRSLRADGLKVVVFRQTRTNGAWSDAQPSPDTGHKLEDAILTRARELRLASLNQGT
jgi:Domain of unknown function (DUF3576)